MKARTTNKLGFSSVMEDYLKEIYHLLEEKGKANTNDLARVLDVSAPTVTQMTKKLACAKLIKRVPYKGFELTESGMKVALEVIRHHRLLEQFLHEALGVPWEKVHDEAERLEHVISEDVERRMAEALNNPTHDPHGAPIPSEELVIESEELTPLSDLEEGQRAVVREVSDSDPELLKHMGEMGLVPSAEVEIVEVSRGGGPITLRVGGHSHSLSLESASTVKVKTV